MIPDKWPGKWFRLKIEASRRHFVFSNLAEKFVVFLFYLLIIVISINFIVVASTGQAILNK